MDSIKDIVSVFVDAWLETRESVHTFEDWMKQNKAPGLTIDWWIALGEEQLKRKLQLNMWDCRQAYKDYIEVDEGYFCIFDYYPLIKSLGFDILIQVDEDDYQGDSFILLKCPIKGYGILVFGWGSCDGCDALQSCSNWREIAELRLGMFYAIDWFETTEDIKSFLTKDTRAFEWYAESEVWVEFREGVLVYFDSIKEGKNERTNI